MCLAIVVLYLQYIYLDCTKLIIGIYLVFCWVSLAGLAECEGACWLSLVRLAMSPGVPCCPRHTTTAHLRGFVISVEKL